MAGRGPAPKDPGRRVRRNADSVPVVVLPARYEAQPALPDLFPWPERTRQWWQMWATAPQAELFTQTDWDFLLDTALIHADIWGNWNLDRMPELRLRVAKFGATPEDRARLRIQFAAADEADEKRSRPQIGAAARERRGPLTAV